MPEESKKENIQESPVETKEEASKKQVYSHANKLALIVGILLVVLGMAVFGAIAISHNQFGYGFGNNNHMFYGRSDHGIGRHGMNGMMSSRGVLQDRISGKVANVNGKSFTIDASGTTYNVQISDTTRFPINSATTVKTGDTVLVWGQKDGNGVIQATKIAVNPQTTY